MATAYASTYSNFKTIRTNGQAIVTTTAVVYACDRTGSGGPFFIKTKIGIEDLVLIVAAKPSGFDTDFPTAVYVDGLSI